MSMQNILLFGKENILYEKIQLTDVYEIVFFILHGAEILEITPLTINGKITCQILIGGEKLKEVQYKYFSGKAEVNLFTFRRTFAQVHSWMSNAKREYKNQLNQKLSEPGAGS